jgi:hypothetical protein
MLKLTGRRFLVLITAMSFFLMACHDDAYLTIPPPPPDVSFTEEFDTVTAAYARGWKVINVSDPKGTGTWTQGLYNDPNVTGFPAAIPFNAWSSKGSYPGFIGADYTSTSADAGIISNWLTSPVTLMKNGDKIIFYSRTVILPSPTDSTDYGNRLQVRVSSTGESINVGSGNDPGDFTTTLLDINPFYKSYHSSAALFEPLAYPSTWTRFTATVGGLNGPVKGRFAFRYYVQDGGYNGRGTAVAIDSVAFISAR